MTIRRDESTLPTIVIRIITHLSDSYNNSKQLMALSTSRAAFSLIPNRESSRFYSHVGPILEHEYQKHGAIRIGAELKISSRFTDVFNFHAMTRFSWFRYVGKKNINYTLAKTIVNTAFNSKFRLFYITPRRYEHSPPRTLRLRVFYTCFFFVLSISRPLSEVITKSNDLELYLVSCSHISLSLVFLLCTRKNVTLLDQRAFPVR